MIGIDIVNIERFEKFLKRKNALKKYLSEDEMKLIKSPSTAAGFFAAKEAISKALKTGIGTSCSFHDIRIYKTEKNAPYFTLTKNIIKRFNITETSLSITHDGGFAIAVAIIIHKNEISLPLSH
jgi:holo-[acyl-carrier protein] synthase